MSEATLESNLDRSRTAIVYIAGFLYTLSLHKYVSRDPLVPGTGIQGVLEFVLVILSLLLTLEASRSGRRRAGISLSIVCFLGFGLFALASSWRSFNPPLSYAKALIMLAVLAIAYLGGATETLGSFFQAVYWTYTSSLVLGLALGMANPSHFPLWMTDSYDGRTRLGVFGTFPGVMGETAAYLILLAPVIFRGHHWLSRMFLLAMNFVAGGKTSTAMLLMLLLVENFLSISTRKSWRTVISVTLPLVLFSCFVAYSLYQGRPAGDLLNGPLGSIYGHDVAKEATSLDGRLDLWKGSASILADNLVLGYGFDGVREELLRLESWSGQSHNGFLELGLAGGGFALLLFVAGLGFALQTMVQSAPDMRKRTLLVFTYLLIISLTGITFTHPSDFGLLVIVLLFEADRIHPAVREPRGALENRNLATVEFSAV